MLKTIGRAFSILIILFVISFLLLVTVQRVYAEPVNTQVGDVSGFYDFHSILTNCVTNGVWEGNDTSYPYPNTYAQLVYVKTKEGKNGGVFDVYKVLINETDIIGRLRIGPVETSSAAWLRLKFPEDNVNRVNGIVVLYKNEHNYVVTIHPSTSVRAVFSSPEELTVCDTHISLTKILTVTSWDQLP